MHNKYSHMMDALRYAAMGVKEIDYLGLNSDGSDRLNWNQMYSGPFDEEEAKDDWLPATYKKKEKRTDAGLYYYE